MDLSKLTPEPWVADYIRIFGKDRHHVATCRGKNEHADAEFIALARNAFAGDPEALAWWEANRKRRSPPSV